MLKTTSLHLIVTDRQLSVKKQRADLLYFSTCQPDTFLPLISPYGDMEHKSHLLIYSALRDGHGILACRLAALSEYGEYHGCSQATHTSQLRLLSEYMRITGVSYYRRI